MHLRRLAEQARDLRTAGALDEWCKPETIAAILALLDSRDMWADTANRYHRKRNEAECRAAALEGQIDAIREAWEQRHVKPEWMDGVQRILDQEAAR